MTIVDVEIPAPTCPGIDKAIEGLEELRNQNSHLRMGVLHYRQLYTEAAALIEKMAEALRRNNTAMLVLISNAHGCIRNHHPDPSDGSKKSAPGWLTDCEEDLRRARDILKELGQ